MIYCIIPARGGSKSIPLKNIKEINGMPLIWWVLNAANDSIIDKIFVATDSKEIGDVVNGFNLEKIVVIGRSEESSGDKSPTEVVMREFATQYEFDDLVLIQATSPLLKTVDINNAIKRYKSGDYDSILPLNRQKRFLWENENGWKPINFDPKKRPMRQDFDGFVVENGCMFVVKRERFLKENSRICGKIIDYEFPENTYLEIDEPDDWVMIEALLRAHNKYL